MQYQSSHPCSHRVVIHVEQPRQTESDRVWPRQSCFSQIMFLNSLIHRFTDSLTDSLKHPYDFVFACFSDASRGFATLRSAKLCFYSKFIHRFTDSLTDSLADSLKQKGGLPRGFCPAAGTFPRLLLARMFMSYTFLG